MSGPYPEYMPEWLERVDDRSALHVLARSLLRALPGIIGARDPTDEAKVALLLKTTLLLVTHLRDGIRIAFPVETPSEPSPQSSDEFFAFVSMIRSGLAASRGLSADDYYLHALHLSGNVIDQINSGVDAFSQASAQIDRDVRAIEAGVDLFQTPLFTAELNAPRYWSYAKRFPAEITALTGTPFWGIWWERYQLGHPIDHGIEQDIARLRDDEWQSSQGLLAAIEQATASALIRMLPYAETLTFQLSTAQFHSEPIDVGKPDLHDVLVSRVRDALADVVDDVSNGINRGSREYKVLTRSVTVYASDPQRLEMDFSDVQSAIARQIFTGDLPNSEENIGLQNSLEEALKGIRITNPEVAQNRKLLTERDLAELADEQKVTIQEALPVLVALSDEDLAEDWRRDVAALTSDAHGPMTGLAPSSANTDVAARFFNRVAKISFQLRIKEVLEAIEKSPVTRTAGILELIASLVMMGITLVG